jgi:sigma-B regulation protein RsbU (phosphoserine phosphatase)
MSGTDVAILVVDDSSFNRLLLRRRLAELGYPGVTVVEDGVQALAAMAEHAFDVVLLDLEMPNLDGIGVLERMRGSGRDEPPVIVISALTDTANIIRCIELGAEDYLPKSFDPPLLRARLGAVLEKKRLRDLAAQRLAALEGELESARSAQLSLVPRDFAALAAGRILLHAAMIPAKQVGGDLYDILRLDDRHLLLTVADVSGKGAPAGLTMARTLGLMRAAAKLLATSGAPPDPADILCHANADLAAGNDEQTFVTVVVLVLDSVSGTGRMALAGHESPLRLGSGGVTVVDPAIRQPPLGIMEGFPYASEPVALAAGEALVLFSDGVTEAEDGLGGFLGRERLVDCLGPTLHGAPAAIIDAVLRQVVAFAGDAPQADDITALAIRFG